MKTTSLPCLAIITPCFNEEESVKDNLKKLVTLINDLIIEKIISSDSCLCIIDDGSTDTTLQKLKTQSSLYNLPIYIIELSSNAGHQRALLSGIHWSTGKCDCSISIDFDLQDDINVIPEMINKYVRGADLVLGVRNNRDTDDFFKRWSASSYYKLAKQLGMNITPQHADFRLASNQIMERLQSFEESDIYLRSVMPQLTRKIDYVYYRRALRQAGETKYTFAKMLRLARQSIFAQTNALLLGIGAMIIIYSILSIAILGWIIFALATGAAIPGWSSILITILVTSTVTLSVQYMMAEHMTLMSRDIKKRPQYLIEKVSCNQPGINS